MLIKQIDIDQLDYYISQLYALQDKVLSLVDSDKFYLTGGTCLSRHYYHHRYSDDLDFFFLGERYDSDEFDAEFVRIMAHLGTAFKIAIAVNEKTFKRAFVEEGTINLKIEFVNEPFPVLGERIMVDNFLIDTKENIAVNKITAIYSRKACKDYFDLFFLLREFSLHDLLHKSAAKMVPPSFEELILSLETSLWEGQVLTSLDIDEADFLNFTSELIKDLLRYAKQTR
jgi:predicted nucleotidyltransferase component of viral defense system